MIKKQMFDAYLAVLTEYLDSCDSGEDVLVRESKKRLMEEKYAILEQSVLHESFEIAGINPNNTK